MNPLLTIALKVGAALIKAAIRHTRKRGRGQEDCYIPAGDPALLGLKVGECMHCHKVWARPYPKRRCVGGDPFERQNRAKP